MDRCSKCVHAEDTDMIGRCADHVDIASPQFADAIFRAFRTYNEADSLVYQLLNDLLGEDGWLDSSWDYYDRSLEAYGVPVDEPLLSETQTDRLWSLGFLRCWTNHVDGTETLYQRGRPPQRQRGRHGGARHDDHRHHEIVKLRANVAALTVENARLCAVVRLWTGVPPSPTPIECERCERLTTTGICAECASLVASTMPVRLAQAAIHVFPPPIESDQCGAVGNPRDPKTQVCVPEPGHDGPHKALRISHVIIEPSAESDPIAASARYREQREAADRDFVLLTADRCVNGFTREQHLAFDSYCRCDHFEKPAEEKKDEP